MAARGWVTKRCPHGITGTPDRAGREAIPACRCKQGSWGWRVAATRDPVTGSRRQPSRAGYPTRAAAWEGLTEQLDAMRRGTAAHDRGLTVGAWLTRWLAAGDWEPSTALGYARHVDSYLNPTIGSIRLRDLDRPAIAAMLTLLAAADPARVKKPGRGGRVVTQRSPKTVDSVRRTLRSALSAAQEEGLITVNHAAGRFKQIGKRRSGGASWWQPDQLRTFLDAVAGDELVALWTVAGLAGLRRSELCGLRWVDVDLSGPQPGLTVRQKVVDLPGLQPCGVCGREHRGRQIRGGSKTAAGTARWVPLTSESVRELLAHQAAQEALRGEAGDHWSAHGLVFAGPDGAPLRPDAVTHRHAALVAEVGLPRVKLHEMRHGAASLLAAAGLSIELIAVIMGHSTEEVTKSIYVHGMRSQLGAAAEAAAGLVRAPGATAGGGPVVP